MEPLSLAAKCREKIACLEGARKQRRGLGVAGIEIGDLFVIKELGGHHELAGSSAVFLGGCGGLAFSGESTGARAGALVTDWRRLGRPRTLGEIAAEIEGVTLDQLNAYLSRRTLGTLTIQTLGPTALNAY